MNKEANPRPTGTQNRPTGAGASTKQTTTNRPAGERPRTPVRNGSSTGTPARNGAGAPRRQPPKQQSVGLKPLDIALLVAGVSVVVIVAFLVLSAQSGQPTIAPGVGTSAQQQQNQAAQEPPKLAEGTAAPDFTLPGVDGNTYKLSDYRGKVVVLEFMAPWCPHCQADAPIFNNAAQTFQGQDVQFLAISATPDNKDRNGPISMADMTWFRDTFGVSYPMLFDQPLAAAKAYQIYYYPTVYIVDKEGKIAKFVISETDNPISVERLSNEINNVLQ
ncbi:MAG TPA: TlpA disulfide reductase family protein [Chloroflexia bacterium]|jgi:peroxiredoxin